MDDSAAEVLELVRDRMLAIRAAYYPGQTLPSVPLPEEVQAAQSILQLGLRTTPLESMMAVPLLMTAADTYAQWLEQVHAPSLQRNN